MADAPLYKDALLSECGGLGAETLALTAGDYCAAELLDWVYDAETGELSLLHQRASLNCCGEHAVAASWNGEQIVVSAVDEPTSEGRCRCDCVYDFGLTVLNVQAGATPQALVWRLEVAEDAAPRVVFEGTLDLGLGAETITLDQTAVMNCEQAPVL